MITPEAEETIPALEVTVRAAESSFSKSPATGAFFSNAPLAGFLADEVYTAALEAEAAYFNANIDSHVAQIPRLQTGRVLVFSSPAEASGIVFFKNSGEVVISYHGTSSLRNMATNLWAVICFPFFMDRGFVHSGFYHGFLRSWDNLYPLLADHAASLGLSVADLDITVTGHSLGAALATICAYRLVKVSAVKKIRVATFASPRVFSLSASAEYKNTLLSGSETKLGSVTLRIAQKGDPITEMPHSTMGYKHVGVLIAIERDKAYYPHEMMGYLSGLEAFLSNDVDLLKRKETSYGLMRSLRSFTYSSELANMYQFPQIFKRIYEPLGEDPDAIIEKTYQSKPQAPAAI